MKTWQTQSGEKIIQVLAGRSNVFLLMKEETTILIDTSPAYRWKKLQKRLSELKVKKIDFLVVTHAHFDHVGSASKIKEIYGAKVLVQRCDAENLATGNNFMIAGTTAITKPLVKLFGKMVFNFCHYTPCQPDIVVDNYFELNKSGCNAYLLYTPGHTPGCMSLVVNNEVALVGDSMFGVFRNSIFPPFATDVDEMIKSWKTLLQTGCHTFLPSHGSSRNRDLVEKEFKRKSIEIGGRG